MSTWRDLVGTVNTVFKIGLKKASLDASGLTGPRTFALPDTSGTLALTSQLASGAADVLSYADRASMRIGSPLADRQKIVMGLGMFVFVASSTEPDDDETAFAATGGVWELAAADPDYVFASWIADFDQLQAQVDDNAAKLLRGSFQMTLTGMAAGTASNFIAAIAGAAPGDSVLVTPGDSFGTGSANQAYLSFAAYVSANNTVTISIRCGSTGANLTASTWAVLVIKQ